MKRDTNTTKRMYRAKLGCKGDPRMNRAVRIRLANPKMSLVDALLAGGFTFPKGIKRQNTKEGAIYDSDGATLNQRRNQLSKRLWQIRRKTNTSINTSYDQEKALSDRSNVLICTAENKDRDYDIVRSVEADILQAGKVSLSKRHLHQLPFEHANQALGLKDVELNGRNKKLCQEDCSNGLSRLLDLLSDVPNDFLKNNFTLEQIMRGSGTCERCI